MRDILRNDFSFVYLSWDGPKLVGREVFDRYWRLAEELGRDRNPYRPAFLQVVAAALERIRHRVERALEDADLTRPFRGKPAG